MFPASLPASGHSPLLLLATISRKCLPSALRCSLSAASKQALLFIVWAEREVLWGHGARERGEVSVQECAWASLWVDTGQMTERESLAKGSRGTPSNTSSPVSLPFPSLLSFPFCLSCPLTLSILVSSTQLSASLSAIKNIIQPGRHSNGETGSCQTAGAWKTAEPTPPPRCCWPKVAREFNRVQPEL